MEVGGDRRVEGSRLTGDRREEDGEDGEENVGAAHGEVREGLCKVRYLERYKFWFSSSGCRKAKVIISLLSVGYQFSGINFFVDKDVIVQMVMMVIESGSLDGLFSSSCFPTVTLSRGRDLRFSS